MKLDIPSVGSPMPRVDAWTKVRGREKYAIDEYEPDMLWAGVKRAGIPHGLIQRIDTQQAAGLPGVFRIVTRPDVPGTNRQGIVHKDQPVLAGSRIRHGGEPVALILAENRETLKQAIAAVQVHATPLPGIFDPEEAMKPEAPRIHDNGNILLRALIEKGDAIGAFSNCDIILEDCFEVPFQEHACLETENGIARLHPDGTLHMTVSTQAPFRDRMEIAHALGLDFGTVRIKSPCLGGGFGGKDGATVQCLLALAAMNARGRPVKMVWDREESFIAGTKRHMARMHYRVGARKDGCLQSLHCRLIYDTGAYAHLGGEVMELGMEHAGGPYRIPHTRIEGFCVYTNHPVGGAMRGFGVCQVSFAMEQMINRLAETLNMDPLELRRKNALHRGDTNCSGVTLVHSTGMTECLRTVGQHPLWKERNRWKEGASAFHKRGVGVAAVWNAMGYGRGLPDSAIARIELTPAGRFRIYNGVSDMGQGNSSAFVQMACDMLCQNAQGVELIQPDTAESHPSGSSSAGRTTYTFGNALIRACNQMKQKLLHRTALMLMLDNPAGLALLPGCVRHLPSGREIPLSALASWMPETDRNVLDQHVMVVSQDQPNTGKDFPIGFPHVLFAYAAHLAGIQVDELTGSIQVLFYLAVTDGGRIINPSGFHTQVHGAVAQGLGYALSEEILVASGRILNPSFTDYILPTSLDVPDVVSLAVETLEDTGPFGMKGIGEVGVNAPLPAVAGAVWDATGKWITRSPITPERMMAALYWEGSRPADTGAFPSPTR